MASFEVGIELADLVVPRGISRPGVLLAHLPSIHWYGSCMYFMMARMDLPPCTSRRYDWACHESRGKTIWFRLGVSLELVEVGVELVNHGVSLEISKPSGRSSFWATYC